MLRDPNLVPLSHQHQHALALCVRLERAPKADAEQLAQWNREVDHIFRFEIRFHFDAEERLLFPEAIKFPEIAPLVNELLREHGILRRPFDRAANAELDATGLTEFATMLSAHVRKEERQLFERCQGLMTPEQMSLIGTAMNEYFKAMPGASCAIKY
jgi:hemerythrin-like domain-containing protein